MVVDILARETIPMVVATGATTRIAEKALPGGRRKSRKATTKRKAPRWHKANWHPAKATAEKDAGFFKKAGHKTKIVKEYNKYFKKWGYTVYVA
ncbi:hypothetical protein KKE60_08855 [Patescibacteria group bacterium]|nr:hypothetical protein [Patescibacteria group bacterium]